jgi:hypothetical protein
MDGEGRKKFAKRLKDNPGRPGKGRVRLVGATPLSLFREKQRPEAGFTSSSGSVRALSVNAKKELSGQKRLETVSNRVK